MIPRLIPFVTVAALVAAATLSAAAPPSPSIASTVEVVSDGTEATVLRFEATPLAGSWPSGADAPEGDDAPLVYSRNSGAARTGAGLWRAEAYGPASFSVLVRVPDAGKIEFELGSTEFAAATPSGGSHELSHESLVLADVFDVSEPAVMRDLRVVRVTYSPFPAERGSDAVVTSATLTVRATGGTGVNEKVRRGPEAASFRSIYESRVLNYRPPTGDRAPIERFVSGGRDPIPVGGRYLIITRDIYETRINPLAEWKHRKGVQTKTVNLSVTGSTTQSIRDYIQNAYDTWDVPPEYVLLVADTEVIPIYEGEAPTDNYYATLEGDDYLADIMIGRISADSYSHVETQVQKAFYYERSPIVYDPDWMLGATLMVADDFDYGDSIYYSNTWQIYNLLDNFAFSPIDTLFRRNDSTTGDVYASVNAGKGFLNFRGQGYYNWNHPFDINPSNTSNIKKLPIVVSATCGTGTYHADNFVCESWVRAGSPTGPKGAVAFFGQNMAVPSSGGLSMRRGYVDTGFFVNTFQDGGRTLGEACVAGKLNLFMRDPVQSEYEGWNLLGDPELNIWTDVPANLSVDHILAIQVGEADFYATVESGGQPLEGALVACVKGDEVYAWGYTDAAGEISFVLEPVTAGMLDVTVTAQNHRPYETEIQVLESGPFVIYSSLSIDDAAGGNGDGYLSPGETAHVEVQLANVGDEASGSTTATIRTSDTYATLIDSVASFDSIPAQSTAWGTDTWELSLPDGCPPGHEIQFSTKITFGGETLVAPAPALPVSTGRMVHQATVVADEAPGGNGDGIAGPGETVTLVLTLENQGVCGLTDLVGTLVSASPHVAVTSGTAEYADADPGAIVTNASVPYVISVRSTAPDGVVAPLELVVTATGHSYTYEETLTIEIDLSGPALLSPTGPDGYGYYAYDSFDTVFEAAPAFEWMDISPPGPGILISEISDDDAGTTTVALPFWFQYYGTDFLQVSICSNGFISMGVTDYRFGDNTPIPDLYGPPNMIAPMWDDLDPSSQGDIYKYWDQPNHRWIVQFDEVVHWNTMDAETFQVVFLDPVYYPTPTGDGRIVIQYETVSAPATCTVGIEDTAQQDGIQYLFDGVYGTNAAPLVDGTAIAFTTAPPGDPDAPWLVFTGATIDDDEGGNGDGVADPGETISLAFGFENQGALDADDVSITISCSETAVSIVDSTATLPDIPAGGQGASADGDLSIVIDDVVTDPTATLWAFVEANGGTYEQVARFDLAVELSTGIDGDEITGFRFTPCHPNPFREGTSVRLSLPHAERVSVRIYNTAGRLVKTVVDDRLAGGEHVIPWDGTNGRGDRVASGVYLMRLETGSRSLSRKAVLLR